MSRAFFATAGALLAIPFVSSWRQVDAPWHIHLLIGGLTALTLVRPVLGLTVLAGLFPLALPTGLLLGDRAWAERMLIAFLVPAVLRLSFDRNLTPQRLAWPATLFVILLAASGAAQLSFLQQRTLWPGPYFAALWEHLSTTYFAGDGNVGIVHDTLAWIETVTLAVVAEQLARQSPHRAPVLLRMFVAGSAGLALFNVTRLAEIGLRVENAFSALSHVLWRVRFNPFYGDLNAAGSLFVLLLVPAIALAWFGHRPWAWIAVALLTLSTWLAGSRAAFVAAGIATGGLWLTAKRPGARSIAAFGAAGIVLLLVVTMSTARNASVESAAAIRIELTKVAMRLTAREPLLGVGLGTFRTLSVSAVSDDAGAEHARFFRAGENAHNNFLQILAELGVLGFGTFLWLVVPQLWYGWRTAATRLGSPDLLALLGAVSAFLLTSLLGHPLIHPHIRGLFFLCLGIGTGLLAQTLQLPSYSTRIRATSMIVIGALLVYLPFRVAEDRRTARLDGVVYGALKQNDTVDGTHYSRAEAHSTWFVPSSAREIEIPMRHDGHGSCGVAIALDSNPAATTVATSDQWISATIAVPETVERRRSHRLDLVTQNAECSLLVGEFKTSPNPDK